MCQLANECFAARKFNVNKAEKMIRNVSQKMFFFILIESTQYVSLIAHDLQRKDGCG